MGRMAYMLVSRCGPTGAWILVGVVGAFQSVSAQGCMPLKFTSPSLGGASTTVLEPHELRVGLAVRRVATNKFFVGTSENEAAAPGGQPLNLRLNAVDVSVTYATSSRFSLTATAPLSFSTASNINPDGLRHDVSASGVGDVSLVGNFWIVHPLAQSRGNMLLGLGVKAPTGSYHSADAVYTPAGAIQAPVTQTLQPGDGGWGIIASADAFEGITDRLSVYASGVYTASLRQHTDVLWPPAGMLWAVPDVYSARAGLALNVAPDRGVSVSLGWRIDGTTMSDIVGGRDNYFRHAGYTMFIDPGFSYGRGRDQFTVSVPIRVRENYLAMFSAGHWIGGAGGVADYVIYAGYSHRM